MRYWTSDLHVGHARIIELCERPFKDVNHMNAELIRRWNAIVADEDEVWVVGDLAMGQKDVTVPLCAQFAGRKFLIPGNHDSCWRGGKKNWHDNVALYEDSGFTILDHDPGDWVSTQIAGTEVAVCHFPTLHSDYDKYSAWRPETPGWVVHGHTHATSRKIGRNVHVGVDAWDYTPVSDDQLAVLLTENVV